MCPVCWNIITQIAQKYVRDTLIPTILFNNTYIYIAVKMSEFNENKLFNVVEKKCIYIYMKSSERKSIKTY